jgi:transposase
MNEPIIEYIKKELKNPELTEENKEWLEALKYSYQVDSVGKAILKYGKTKSTFYRRRSQLEELFQSDNSYQDRFTSNSSLSIRQHAEIEQLIEKSIPIEAGLHGLKWTGRTLSAYIKMHYDVYLGARECQRLIRDTNFIQKSEEDVYFMTLESLLAKGYEVWHIRSAVIWKEQKTPYSKTGRKKLKHDLEGIILGYNPYNENKNIDFFTSGSYMTFSKMLYSMIDMVRDDKKKTLVILSDNSRAQRILAEANELIAEDGNKERDELIIAKPKSVDEVTYFKETISEIKYAFSKIDFRSKDSHYYKFRKKVKELVK